ncbi:cytochrome c oxidase accessory protein CcoG [Geminisphaera colitermitum]|uniref:cytochrome c oxidase accessory protein CcoG n=1 Tax=Geminisphaera colitermitum TaxID=1148786 RepID=UPI000196515C|nr:cytochrome c oxidase accessory protein CcoG [Geminisphaera colitermitum]
MTFDPKIRPNRDSVTTIRDDGSRLFLHPADARGRFTRLRRITGWLLIAFYLALPWIPINGSPAVFLDVASRRFHLFGGTLAFQDAWLMFFGITGLGFTLFFITAILGRVWCGWACPQTVFLEHVYRRVERWIEGDAVDRRRLDAAPWTNTKIIKRIVKHTTFIFLSAGIAHLFLAYFVSLPQLWSMMTRAPGAHWGSFVFVAIATGILYFNFAWFREQLCLIICPYGRLQSVLIDDNSLVIGYDAKRGEPRGRPGTPDAGACIDCQRCVQVCPTGIDIRQGLQIECIACSACVDACDEVMDKLKRPRGLVRYDSTNGLAGQRTRWLRPRVVIYAILFLVGAMAATLAFSTVRPAAMSVTRMTGAPYFVTPDTVRNQYFVRIVNKSTVPVRFRVTAHPLPPATDKGLAQFGFEGGIEVAPLAEVVQPFILQVSRDAYAGKFNFRLQVQPEDAAFTLERELEFIGPDAELLREEKK